ncbi:TIGR04283 family arsenosugar biosynthesis glycosyltransferase [Gracilimonas amylolytica]|uniref:TIGR04283 family arsenosugar biosynthesis glycosyltransferase n=1 Tax=Gracilimonas amylolytica TaxID=1749045 RepID=UPI000CD96AB2|nr:TIGR04283 family arsenosugar biosynthesis glycosyltransferase [Gracilimonas amylolytica]
MVSIIIPVFNEEKNIGKLVAFLKENTTVGDAEIIVVDGGSKDQTAAEAEKAGASVHKSPKKGRAQQMNYGAKVAKGEWLYFLHADSFPPPSFLNDIQKAIESGACSGCFRLTFDRDHPALTFYAWFTKFDVDLFRFGDQSLFVEKKVFNEINGFDEALVVMEDQEIVRRIKKRMQFRIIPKSVTTSARRYEEIGVFKLQLIFSIIVLLFYAGVKQETIVNFYRSHAISKTY